MSVYNVSARIAFLYLYPHGEKSPLDFGDFKMSHYLLKKQTLFAYKMADAQHRLTGICRGRTRMVELMIKVIEKKIR